MPKAFCEGSSILPISIGDIMKTWLEDNLLEKRHNSDFKKIVELFCSNDPRYCFGIISACRGIQYDASDKTTQKIVDDNNRRNKRNTSLLFHNLAANCYHTIEVKGSYLEKGVGRVYEDSYLVYAPIGKEKELYRVLVELGKLFDQDTIMFVDAKEHIGHLIWLRDDSEELDWVTNFNNSNAVMDFSQNNIEGMFIMTGTAKAGRKFRIHSLEEKRLNYGIYTIHGYGSDPTIIKSYKLDDVGYIKSFREAFKNNQYRGF